MPQLRIDVIRDPAKFIRLDVAINLRVVSEDGAPATVEIDANVIHHLMGFAVAREPNVPLTVQLRVDPGFRVGFVEDPANTTGIVNWRTSEANESHLRFRRFFVAPVTPPPGGSNE